MTVVFAVCVVCWRSRGRWVVGVVCVVSTLYNVPRWFEYRPETQTFNDTNITTLVASSTWLVSDPIYLRVYYSWLYLPVMCIVPLVALSTINASLVLAVRRSRADRKRMNVRQHRENNVTLMLVSVVAVFIVCQVPTNKRFYYIYGTNYTSLPLTVPYHASSASKYISVSSYNHISCYRRYYEVVLIKTALLVLPVRPSVCSVCPVRASIIRKQKA